MDVICAVSDNAANMIATANELKIKHLPCAAHRIQLVVNTAILLTKPIQPEDKDNFQKEINERNEVELEK